MAAEHACIEVKAGRLYCSALVGDPDNFLDETHTWLNDSELRPGTTDFQHSTYRHIRAIYSTSQCKSFLLAGCSYLLSPGAKLAFGEHSCSAMYVFVI